MVRKLANFLKKFDQSVASMESGVDAINLKQNQRTTKLFCKDCKQNNLSDCWHCFESGHEGHTAQFCSEKKGN